jgi:hypothetical protein
MPLSLLTTYRFNLKQLQNFDFNTPRRLHQQSGSIAIRAYTRHVLIAKYEVDPSSADAAASQWDLGRAQDLQ